MFPRNRYKVNVRCIIFEVEHLIKINRLGIQKYIKLLSDFILQCWHPGSILGANGCPKGSIWAPFWLHFSLFLELWGGSGRNPVFPSFVFSSRTPFFSIWAPFGLHFGSPGGSFFDIFDVRKPTYFLITFFFNFY